MLIAALKRLLHDARDGPSAPVGSDKYLYILIDQKLFRMPSSISADLPARLEIDLFSVADLSVLPTI
jgi:hypothetical protein